MAKKQRFQLQFTFWLDMLNSEQQAIADYVEHLKAQRTFAKTVCDGLRLMRDLREGRLDVLFNLYPLLKAEFIAGIMPKPDNDPSGNAELRRELDEIKSLLLLHSTTAPIVAAPAGTPRVEQAFNLPSSIFVEGSGHANPADARKTFAGSMGNLFANDDDDDDMLVVAKDTTARAGNILNSGLALQPVGLSCTSDRKSLLVRCAQFNHTTPFSRRARISSAL